MEATQSHPGPMRTFRLARGTILLVVAYAVVSALGFGLFLVISAVLESSPWAAVEIRDNRGWQLTAKVLPLLNLIVWTASAVVYFRRFESISWRSALELAGYWFAIVVIIDYLAFVLPRHSLSADANGFYLGQGLWIYLTHAAVFAGPLLGRFLTPSRAADA